MTQLSETTIGASFVAVWPIVVVVVDLIFGQLLSTDSVGFLKNLKANKKIHGLVESEICTDAIAKSVGLPWSWGFATTNISRRVFENLARPLAAILIWR